MTCRVRIGGEEEVILILVNMIFKIINMKRILFFIAFIGILPMLIFSQESQDAAKKQVAILEPIAVTKEVTTMYRSMVRGEMQKAIGRQEGYAAFSRQDIDQIMNEHNFQASGMVNEETRKRLGAMQGVDYVCITKITKEGNSFYLEASLVNIETGQISNPASQFGELRDGSLVNMIQACEKLGAEVVGKKVSTSSYSSSYSYSRPATSSSSSSYSSTSSSTSNKSATQSYSSAKIISCDSRVDVRIISCVRKGEDVVFTFQLTNEGLGPVEQMRLYYPKECNLVGMEQTLIYDNLGNEYSNVRYTFRGVNSNIYYGICYAFPEELPCKATITIPNVPSSATILNFKLAFTCYPFSYYKLMREQIVFKNVPIY